MKPNDRRSSLIAETFKQRPHLVFFALAALQAVFIIPLTVFRVVSGPLSFVSLGSGWPLATWHAHEMIFGFALGVMGGYFAGKYSPRQAVFLAASWVLARVAVAGADATGVGIAPLAGLYPVLLFVFAGLPILRAAKTLRNAAFGLILGALAIVDIGLLVGSSMESIVSNLALERLGLLLIVMMSFVMGGRITAAVTSGAHQAMGRKLVNAAQIPLERAGVLLFIGLAILLSGGYPAGWISLFCLGLAAITGARLSRWQFWKLRNPSVLGLHAGFLWLLAGFTLIALQPALPWFGLTDVLHTLAIGALGTFTLTVMTRTILQKARRDISFPPIILFSLGAVNLAAVFRVAAFASGRSDVYLLLAAGAWTVAWVLFLVFLMTTARYLSEKSYSR